MNPDGELIRKWILYQGERNSKNRMIIQSIFPAINDSCFLGSSRCLLNK